MKILVLSQYFWPETFIINDFVKNLQLQGHEVTVATGKPNYPNGKVFPGYKATGIMTESFEENVDIVRVPLWPRGGGGAKNLALNYISFVFSGLLFFPWLLRKKNFDAILVFAPSPITQAIPAIVLKWLHSAHLAIWVQDLWPESLSATGFVKNKFLLQLVGWMVRAIYRFTDTILSQSKTFTNQIKLYAKNKDVFYYPNSFDPESMLKDPSFQPPEELYAALISNFSVVFAGNLGTAQSLDTILEVAEQIKDLDRCKIVLVGSGSLSSWIEKEVQKRQLTNIFIAGRYPMSAMPTIFEASKALLVTLKKDPIFELTIPGKIQPYLASGKPILAAIDGEGSKVISEARCGLVCAAEDSTSLALNIRKMYAMKESDIAELGANGKQFFELHFEMNSQIRFLVELLEQRMAKGRS